MRAVDYVTNGFGGPFDDAISMMQSSGFITPLSGEAAIRQNLTLSGVPDSIINAAILTYRQFGSSGFRKTLAFVDAMDQAENALKNINPNIKLQLSGPMAGVAFKRALNSMLNTAASRIGLNPLSSAILQSVRQRLSSIPDSSSNPKDQFWNTAPMWIATMRSWVGRLVSTF